ncbi:DUF421 domain-containing protein [Nakamurella endophytica]|uniref:YetF C-terminal domain-containing protein n=1 Tax=Nakamurella endophytica TaxID=1748367 RepID=A0A917SSK1_9ACTN|nr:YetF domain-containing protein [Nakamurella endophytica]GGL92910.1 hypothetical protein GCM10011594_10920 [Nakamurella endophytica]
MEIVYRAAVMFLFLWIITRVVGRSTVGELSTFQLILFITMGDMVQQAVTQQDYSFTGGVLTISVFTLLTIALSWANTRWPRLRAITHGVAVLIVDHGEPDMTVLRRERMSLDDLMAAARQQGFERLSDIRLAVLEANGQVSFFARQDSGGEGGNSGAEQTPSVG